VRRAILVVAGLLVLAALTFRLAAVVVDETNQAVVIEFGRPVRVISEPGLYFKIPFIQDVVLFERRFLEYDAQANDIITRDKKTLIMDNYAMWRIIDPLKFLQTVQNEAGATARLDDIIYSQLRVELGRYDLIQIVAEHRDRIMSNVTERSDQAAREYGIQVVDVRIKRADLPDENSQAVFDRMRTEREREARRYRSEGEEEAAKIRAEADKERTIILAEAYRKAQAIRGEGDAEAIRVYAEAFNQDPEFYAFMRSLEAYRKAFAAGQTTVILAPDSEFLRFFRGPR